MQSGKTTKCMRIRKKTDSCFFQESVARVADQIYLPQQFLYFFPEPQGQGSLRPTFGVSRRKEI